MTSPQASLAVGGSFQWGWDWAGVMRFRCDTHWRLGVWLLDLVLA